MKLNKFIASAFVANLVVGTSQVMATDSDLPLKLELSEGSKDQIREHDQFQNHDGAKAKKQYKYQYKYQKSENHSGDIGSSVGDSSNSVGAAGKKVRRR